MTEDPVCEMSVDENKAAATVAHSGRTYYFCSLHCWCASEQAGLEAWLARLEGVKDVHLDRTRPVAHLRRHADHLRAAAPDIAAAGRRPASAWGWMSRGRATER